MSNKNTVVTLALGAIALSTQAHADFLSDSKATLGMRNFYFNNDNRDGPAAPSKTEEWAQGFMLDYKSGYTDGAVGFASLRGGTVIGEHEVVLAGPGEHIKLAHYAEDRSIFARGALAAVRWGHGQKPGLYTMTDVLGL